MKEVEASPKRRKDNLEFAVDESGVLVYRDIGLRGTRLLEPAQPIEDPNLVIGKIGMNTLNPTHFSLRQTDLSQTIVTDTKGTPIGDPLPPGISVFLFWGSDNTKQKNIEDLTVSHMGRKPRSRDTVYVTQVIDILTAGWFSYYAPLINSKYPIRNPLHVLLVPKSTLREEGSRDATSAEREALAKVFLPWSRK